MSSTLILSMLVLGVICARAGAAPQPAKMKEALTTIETALEPEQRIDCKLTFDATMDSLEQEQQMQQQLRQLQQKGCLPSTNKPAEHQDPGVPSVARHGLSGGSSQPVYELQLVVWPFDVPENDDDEFSAPTTTTRAPTTTTRRPTTTRRTTTTTTTAAPTLQPLYEDQLVVFPQMDFEEENFDYFFDELEAAGNPSTTTTRPQRPTAGTGASSDPVRVIENYHVRHPNGTTEHKLVLSNGLVNYLKLYQKRVGDRVINVQEGYNSVPTTGQIPQIETLYYIADERGYRVLRIEHSPMPAVLPIRERQQPSKPKNV